MLMYRAESRFERRFVPPASEKNKVYCLICLEIDQHQLELICPRWKTGILGVIAGNRIEKRAVPAFLMPLNDANMLHRMCSHLSLSGDMPWISRW